MDNRKIDAPHVSLAHDCAPQAYDRGLGREQVGFLGWGNAGDSLLRLGCF